jgi:TRAP-type transport system periplasmic protein
MIKNIMMTTAAAGLCIWSFQAQAQSVAEQYLDGEVSLSTPFDYDGPTITIRYSTFLGSAGATPDLYRRIWERLSEDTNGKIAIEPFWSNSLSDAQTGAFEAISSGLANMGTCYTQLNPGGFDLHFGVQLPTLFTSSSVGTMVFNDVYAEYLRENYERRGVLLARLGLTPPQQLYSKEPIRTLEDMQGKRAWTAGTVATMSVGALGLEPTALRISELYPGFQSGVLDVVPMHDAGAPLFRINEIARYRTPVNLWTNPNEHCINPSFWNGLPSEVQNYLYHWFQVWTQVESQLYYDAEAERAREQMRGQGIDFLELSDEDKVQVQSIYEGVVEKWIEEQEAAGRPGQEMVDAMRAGIEQYAALSEDERMQRILEEPVPGLMAGF